MFIVPVFQNVSSKFKQQCTLNNQPFRLKFFWNTRIAAWFMNILDIEDNVLLSNVRLVPSIFLLRQFSSNFNLPEGDFYLADLESNPQNGEVTFDNFGERYQLIFFTNEELNRGF